MNPLSLARATHASFVGMEARRTAQDARDAIERRSDFFRAAHHSAHDAAAAGAVPEEVLANVCGASAGQELADIEIAHHALHAVSVLHWRTHFGRKGRGDEFRAARTPFALGLKLGDLDSDGRQVENLAFFHAGDGFFAQVVAAIGAVAKCDGLDEIGRGALLEGLARVAGLSAGFAPGVFGSQGFGFALQTVAGGRLAAVGAIFGEAFFEFCNAGILFCDAGFESGDEFANRIQPTSIKCSLDDGA